MNLKDAKLGKISFVLNDKFKELIYKEINSIYFNISERTEYSLFHHLLDKYFINNNIIPKNPSKPDYLAWLLLLTYPQKYIQKLKSIEDLNINFKSENSDFQIIGLIGKDDDDEYEEYQNFNHTCICSQSILNIYKLKNKLSGICFQVGSDCIEKHGLVCKTEIDKYKKQMKQMKESKKEREKEIAEGKPLGFYEEERKNNENIKMTEQLEKALNKQIKHEEKLRKREEKMMGIEDKLVKNILIAYNYKKCLLCFKEGLYNKYNKINICNKCVNNANRYKMNAINNSILQNIRKYYFDECENCEHKFLYRYTNVFRYLCNNCIKIKKIIKCNLCTNIFIDDKKSTDKMCDSCDKKSKICLTCKNIFIPENSKILRCNVCQHRFEYNLIVKNCQDCKEEIEITEKEHWKTFCEDCFKHNLKSTNCSVCDLPFKRLVTETWRKKCRDCYKKAF
jgi:hypothetical protein